MQSHSSVLCTQHHHTFLCPLTLNAITLSLHTQPPHHTLLSSHTQPRHSLLCSLIDSPATHLSASPHPDGSSVFPALPRAAQREQAQWGWKHEGATAMLERPLHLVSSGQHRAKRADEVGGQQRWMALVGKLRLGLCSGLSGNLGGDLGGILSVGGKVQPERGAPLSHVQGQSHGSL